jgi:ribosome biogenesis GTPase / thiamine phosphate phosphatase
MWTLEQMGWDGGRADEFAPHGDAGLEPARVAVAHRDEFVVLGPGGERRARVAGRLRHRCVDVAVGDWVAVTPGTGETVRIDAALPRRTLLVRRAAGTATRPQVLAANVDVVFVVAGLDGDFNPRRVERTLVLIAESGARAVVLLNKADACADAAGRRQAMERAAPGVPVHLVSALHGLGLDVVRAELAPGVTVALVGSSGAGKSTLANSLLGLTRQATGDVRADDSRGRHTTTRRELLVLPGGGVLVDTPGLRELQLWASVDATDAAFVDVDVLARGCRFADCAHRQEPGCAVVQAAADGTLDPSRLASYHKLQAELRHVERQHDAQARSEEERRWRTIHKAARRHRPRW